MPTIVQAVFEDFGAAIPDGLSYWRISHRALSVQRPRGVSTIEIGHHWVTGSLAVSGQFGPIPAGEVGQAGAAAGNGNNRTIWATAWPSSEKGSS